MHLFDVFLFLSGVVKAQEWSQWNSWGPCQCSINDSNEKERHQYLAYYDEYNEEFEEQSRIRICTGSKCDISVDLQRRHCECGNDGCSSVNENVNCHFPFTYKGTIYHACTFDGNSKFPWCGTVENVTCMDGVTATKEWNFCSGDCKIDNNARIIFYEEASTDV